MSEMKVRRVVAGQLPDGSNVLTHVEEVKGITNPKGMQWFGVWGWDKLPTLPHGSKEPFDANSVFPAPGGVKINTVIFPPRYGHEDETASTASDDNSDYAKLEAKAGGKSLGEGRGMHATDSVDLGFVAYGEVVTIHPDGSEEVLRPGDIYIQNGAMHAWRNDSDQPCMITFVVMGTERKG